MLLINQLDPANREMLSEIEGNYPGIRFNDRGWLDTCLMKKNLLLLWLAVVIVLPTLAQKPASPVGASSTSATKPASNTQSAMNGDAPAPLAVTPVATTTTTPDKSAAESPTPTKAINPIIPVATTVNPSATALSATDWVLVYDLCNQQNRRGSALILQNGVRFRQKLFLRHNETIRMLVVGNNPSSGTLTISTQGLVTSYDTTNGLLKLTEIKQPKASAPPAESFAKSAEEQAAEAAQQLIDNYRLALEAVRKGSLFRNCINEADLQAYLNAPVPNTSLSRDDLLRQQQQRLANLPDNSPAKKKGLESLAALQAELDQWTYLLKNQAVSGVLMSASGNDFVRFSASRRSSDGTTTTLLAPLDIPVYGNFRVNISTGFLLNRLVDHSYLAIDEKVWLQNNPPSAGGPTSSTPASGTGVTRKVPVLDSPGWGSVGVGAIAHFYFTTRGSLTPALSVGASLNTTGKYTAMLGPSLIVGNDQRIVLTAGYALGPVARLQEPYREGVAYEYSGATFPTSLRTKGGWSFGLTWNVSSKRTVKAN